MATMYTWDPITGAYILSDTGTFILNDAGAYVQSFSVSTDLLDYAPGSTATFTANVGLGDTVTFTVTDVAGTAVSGTDPAQTRIRRGDRVLAEQTGGAKRSNRHRFLEGCP